MMSKEKSVHSVSLLVFIFAPKKGPNKPALFILYSLEIKKLKAKQTENRKNQTRKIRKKYSTY